MLPLHTTLPVLLVSYVILVGLDKSRLLNRLIAAKYVLLPAKILAVVICSTVKPTTKISSLFILVNNVFTILLHIVKFSRNVTFRNVSCKDEISAVGFTV